MTETTENRLAGLLREQIASEGPIPFVEYMRQALYHPEYGYYMTSRKRIGKHGDFFTSSSVHTLFGRLVARQLVQMWELLGKGAFRVVEQGAGEGHFALDILDAIRREAPDCYRQLSYVLLELSPDNRRRQRELLQDHGDRLVWTELEELEPFTGCFLSNELLDAFPVRLLEMREGEPVEVFVGLDEQGAFREQLQPPSDQKVADYLAWLGATPGEGQRFEVNLAAVDWMRRVGEVLARGFVLTIDYGYPAAELYAPFRRDGTLMCYRQHRADEQPLEEVGHKDITAHVDFTALQKAGVEAGLDNLCLLEQYRFLMGLGFVESLMELQAELDDEQEARALRMSLKNLIMPEGGMGETFKVLVQGRGVGRPDLLCQREIATIPAFF